MYKKFLAMILVFNCFNVSFADTSNNPSALFTNPHQIKIDQLASAQQRINFLEHKNRMSKSQMGGALAGGSILAGSVGGICAAFISNEQLKQQVFAGLAAITTLGIVTGGAVMAFADANNNPSQEESEEAKKLQNYILEQPNK